MQKKRILVIGAIGSSLIRFRGDLLKSLMAEGYKVYAAAAHMEEEIRERLQEIGVVPISYTLQRSGLNPIKDLKTIMELKGLMKEHKIDLVFPYTIKPVIYSCFAARLLNIQVVSLITGLGFTFSRSSKKAKLLEIVTETLYRFALQKNKTVIFQNTDDRDLFLNRKFIRPNQPTAIVNGSGVNLADYPYRVNNNSTKRIVFVMVARLIEEKGVKLYMEAAETLKTTYPKAEFHIIGAPDSTPSAVKLEDLQEADNQGTIVYHGVQRKVSDLLSKSDVFVLPTYYREGIPRSILEALSIGMPIITTDTPGCRETIAEGQNGFLITPKDLLSLTIAMQKILDGPEQIKPMGMASRSLATEKFDVRLINKELIKLLDAI